MHKSDNTLVCHFITMVHTADFFFISFKAPAGGAGTFRVVNCARHSRAREEEPEQLPEGQFYVEKLLSRRRKVTPCILGLLTGPYRAWDV